MPDTENLHYVFHLIFLFCDLPEQLNFTVNMLIGSASYIWVGSFWKYFCWMKNIPIQLKKKSNVFSDNKSNITVKMPNNMDWLHLRSNSLL